MIIVSVGCPCGVGPEVAVSAAARLRDTPRVLVGDPDTLAVAAETVGIPPRRLSPFTGQDDTKKIYVLEVGPKLTAADRKPGKPTRASGRSQLAALEAAYRLVRKDRRRALVTGPISKAAVARSGVPGARRFRGHTEWLERLDGAPHSTMCFWSPQISTSLVTTHLPVSKVPRAVTPTGVERSTVDLAQLLRSTGIPRPKIAIASLNPHAGESELLGKEEARAIVPGIESARRRLGRRAALTGPVGAETAYRLGVLGKYDGVVAMYHDQATVPMKLVAFGEAVNVTMGLSIVRTSVDHGTGYDIAWNGTADPRGMLAAMRLGMRLGATRGRRGG